MDMTPEQIAKLSDVVAKLGGTIQDQKDWQTDMTVDGVRFFAKVTRTGKKESFAICYVTPKIDYHTNTYNEDEERDRLDTSINVGASRSVDAIAKSIQTRFDIPALKKLDAAYRDAEARYKARNQESLELQRKVCEVLGIEKMPTDINQQPCRWEDKADFNTYGTPLAKMDVRLEYGKLSVEIDNVGLNTLTEIVELLRNGKRDPVKRFVDAVDGMTHTEQMEALDKARERSTDLSERMTKRNIWRHLVQFFRDVTK